MFRVRSTKMTRSLKQTARKMMQMMMVINQENLRVTAKSPAIRVIGAPPNPSAIPVISEEEPKPPVPAAANIAAQDAPKLPSSDQLIDKYVLALGGAAAIQR